MKPIFKALTSPFRASKKKSLKKQTQNQANKDVQNSPNNTQDLHEHQEGIELDNKNIQSLQSIKSQEIYSQVEKMIDQLGSMFNFKQKISEKQKKQLIAQLSSMAVINKGFPNKNRIMEEDFFDDQNLQNETSQKQSIDSQQIPSDKLTQSNTGSNFYQKSQDSPNNQQSPEKELHDLFQNFQQEYQKQISGMDDDKTQKQNKSQKNEKISSKQITFTSFSDIKQQVGKFWFKNSSRVLKLMNPKKSVKQPKVAEKKSIKEASPTLEDSKMLKKKSSFSISSFIPSFGKKQSKTLNNTAVTASQHQNSPKEGSQDQNNEKNRQNQHLQWECSSFGLGNQHSLQ